VPVTAAVGLSGCRDHATGSALGMCIAPRVTTFDITPSPAMARQLPTRILPVITAPQYRQRGHTVQRISLKLRWEYKSLAAWILARLRNRSFFSLAVLNEAIRGLLVDLNDRTQRGWGRSWRQLFDELDRPALLPLPNEPYQYAEWKRCRVNLDYHVEIAKHYYSVPHGLVRQEVEARITARTVEVCGP
jgi:hypothetical protein